MFYNAVTGENSYGYAMSSDGNINKSIDMICQHKADGTIIPMKIRMLDEDGAYQEYKIRAYKDLTYRGNVFEMPDVGKVHSQGIYPFECKIECFGQVRVIKLFYNSYDHTWKLSSKH